MQTRQERKRDLITQFEQGTTLTNNNPFLNLFPKELDRFKKEFPNLSFNVKNSHLYFSCKEYKVEIKHKTSEE